MHMIGEVLVPVNNCFKSLRRNETLIDDQNRILKELAQDIENKFRINTQSSRLSILTAVTENNLVFHPNFMFLYQIELSSFVDGL